MGLIWVLTNHEPGKYHVTGFRPLKRLDFTHVISKKAAKQKKTNPTNQKAGFSNGNGSGSESWYIKQDAKDVFCEKLLGSQCMVLAPPYRRSGA